MKRDDLSEIVAHARHLLHEWDGQQAAGDLAENLRAVLAPVTAAAKRLSCDAQAKLQEIDHRLDQFTDSHSPGEARDLLDTLLLGLWIRVEQMILDDETDA